MNSFIEDLISIFLGSVLGFAIALMVFSDEIEACL